MDKLLQKHRESIKRIAGHHGVQSIRVLGSFARGEENMESDIFIKSDLAYLRDMIDCRAKNKSQGHVLN